MKEDTMEIDPEELSDETLKELQDDLDIDAEFAKNKAKEIHINNINLNEPNEISSLTQTSNYINSKYETIENILSLESIKSEVKDVIPKDDQIIIKVKNTNKKYAKIYMNKNSKILSNLLRHKNVDKISEVIGEYIMCKDISNRKYVIPKYISVLSKVRFKIYYGLSVFRRNIDKLSEISKNKIDNVGTIMFTLAFLNMMSIMMSSTNSILLNILFICLLLIALFSILPLISFIVKLIEKRIEGATYTINGSDLQK